MPYTSFGELIQVHHMKVVTEPHKQEPRLVILNQFFKHFLIGLCHPETITLTFLFDLHQHAKLISLMVLVKSMFLAALGVWL